jgi:hypothetical protein
MKYKLLQTGIFVWTLMLCFSNAGFSQNRGFIAGIMAGATASQVDGDKLVGYNKSGLQSGIYLYNKWNSHWGITMEMKFIQKGSRTNSPAPDTVNADPGRYYKLRLNYIEVPFLINRYIKKKFVLETGLGFAYLIQAREDVDGYGMLEPEKRFFNLDLPIYFGVSYLVSERFHINFRYSYSTAPIRNHPANQTWYYDRGQYNNLLSFGMYLNL